MPTEEEFVKLASTRMKQLMKDKENLVKLSGQKHPTKRQKEQVRIMCIEYDIKKYDNFYTTLGHLRRAVRIETISLTNIALGKAEEGLRSREKKSEWDNV